MAVAASKFSLVTKLGGQKLDVEFFKNGLYLRICLVHVSLLSFAAAEAGLYRDFHSNLW